MHDRPDRLLKGASEMVGEEFSAKISVRKFVEADGVLLTFSPPNEPYQCFFIYIAKTEDGFRFYTYENSLDLFGSGDKAVIGEWSPDGKHGNYGPRKYVNADSFVTEVQALP
jgi:hypothetical protein